MYQKKSSSWLKHWDFELIDILIMEIALIGSYLLRHEGTVGFNSALYIRAGVMLLLFDVAVILFSQNYKGIIERTKWQELIATIRHVTIVELLLLLFQFVTRDIDLFSRQVFLVSWAVSVVLCFLIRCAWKKVIRKRITQEKNQKHMLLISTSDHVQTINVQLRQKVYRDFRITAISILDHEDDDDCVETNIPILYGKNRLLEYLRQEVVDEVYIDVYLKKEIMTEMVDTFLSMGITVHVGVSYLPDTLPNCTMEHIGEAMTITSTIKMAHGWELAVKRLGDVVGALVGLIITGIAFLFVAPAIKIADPGPIFFKQKRVGKNGRTFYIAKFRSMYVDAESHLKDLMANNEMQGHMFKMENDPRIIGAEKGPGKGLGNFLRKTSIDELPQFWNILKGDMSLVGTRPPTFEEYEQYDLHHKIRLSMKPGLTGVWQTSGRSNITDFEEVVKMDTYYIENWNIGLDIKLIFKTIGVVFKRSGSK